MRSNMKTLLMIGVVATLIVVAFSHPAAAKSKVFAVTTATISDNDGQTRLLVDFGDLSALNGKKILYAKCYLDIDVDTCNKALNVLEVKPVTRAWSKDTVTWQGSWANAGGDFSDRGAKLIDFQRGRSGVTEFLLTELVQSWIDGKTENHGLILIPKDSGCNYALRSNSLFPSAGKGKLYVRYAK